MTTPLALVPPTSLERVEVYATARRGEDAVVSVRIDGRQVVQIQERALSPAEAMIMALSQALATIAREEIACLRSERRGG